jgi:general secretion pathway protein G
MMRNEKRINSLKKRGGFTLIEVLLVVVIIGILAGILVPKIGGKLAKAQSSATPAMISRIESAIGEYEMEFFVLPDSLDDLSKVKDSKGPFLKPSELNDPWGQKFQYSKPGTHNRGYDLWTTSPDGKEFNSWD